MPPKRNEFFSIEDQYTRLKLLMRNWLIDSSSTTEESIEEMKRIFSESIPKHRRLEMFKPYLDQM